MLYYLVWRKPGELIKLIDPSSPILIIFEYVVELEILNKFSLYLQPSIALSFRDIRKKLQVRLGFTSVHNCAPVILVLFILYIMYLTIYIIALFIIIYRILFVSCL